MLDTTKIFRKTHKIFRKQSEKGASNLRLSGGSRGLVLASLTSRSPLRRAPARGTLGFLRREVPREVILRVLRKYLVYFSPSRLTATRQAGWLDGEMTHACLLRSGPDSKTDWPSWSWRQQAADAEGLSYPPTSTAASCISGRGPAAPAESSLSRAANPLQQECVPQSRRRTGRGTLLEAPPTPA